MSVCRVPFLALLLCALCVPALASAPAAVTAPWNTGVMRTKDDKFAYCITEARYENNLWLIMALNGEGEINIGVGRKGAQLPIGGQRMSSLQVDEQAPVQLPARVTKPDLYVLNVGRNDQLLASIATGSAVTIDRTSFALTGSGEAVKTLQECAQVSAAAAAASSASAPAGPPQDWVVPAAPAEPAAPAAVQPSAQAAPQVVFDEAAAAVPPPPVATPAAAPAVPSDLPAAAPSSVPAAKPLPAQLNTLLVAAGVRDITPAPVPADGSTYAWLSRTMKGAVREETVPAGTSPEQAIERQLARMKEACPAEFTAKSGGPAQEAGALRIMTASTVCRGGGLNNYTTLVLALTRAGLLSVISHELPEGRRAAADRAQAGLVKALKGN